jgi:hypothetical protein
MFRYQNTTVISVEILLITSIFFINFFDYLNQARFWAREGRAPALGFQKMGLNFLNLDSYIEGCLSSN